MLWRLRTAGYSSSKSWAGEIHSFFYKKRKNWIEAPVSLKNDKSRLKGFLFFLAHFLGFKPFFS